MSDIFGIPILTLLFATGIGVLGYSLHVLRAARAAGSWPTTPGKILRCEVVESRGTKGGLKYETKVEYSYTVAGASYTGTRLAYGYEAGSGREAHQEIADRLTGAKGVVVRYDPADAASAVLSYGLNRSTVIRFVLGVAFTVFITGIIVVWYLGSQRDTGLLRTLVTIP
jgi:hypothetical protein